jgi:hypothetical protein
MMTTAAFKLLKAVEASGSVPIDGNVCREAIAESIRFREALEEIELACVARSHPGSPHVISKWHGEDMRAIAAKAHAALTAGQQSDG